jgi:SAM-dependent methyltransferase
MQSKEFFLSKLEESHDFSDGTISILDLGSGESRSVVPLLKRYPQTRYVGVEPSETAAAAARTLLAPFPNARVYTQLAYEPLPDEAPFDIVLSLSVLEHVKQLDRFLTNSIAMTKSGGRIIHRYDLGHSLHPSSIKERFQVFLGNHFPKLLPEHKFVRYVDSDEVVRLLEKSGAHVDGITYHQMPDHKRFLKDFVPTSDEAETLVTRLSEWEFDISPHLSGMQKTKRELLFPAIAVWATKR